MLELKFFLESHSFTLLKASLIWAKIKFKICKIWTYGCERIIPEEFCNSLFNMKVEFKVTHHSNG